MRTQLTLVLAAACCCFSEGVEYSYLDDGLSDHQWYGEGPWPLALLSDMPYSLSHDLTSVPLIAVHGHNVPLLRDPYISSYSPDSNLVTCQYNHHSLEALPAVKVSLPAPVLLAGEEGSMRFPSHLQVEAHGVRFMMPVAALIAPLPDQPYSHPYHVLTSVYAVPAFNYRHPIHYPTYPTYSALSYPRPNGLMMRDDPKENNPIRILEFPNRISTPTALLKPQVPLDEELVNRGPPETAVIPAGLVQSAQPRPFITNFINSKESPLLQSFRDEANKHREFLSKPGVEAL